ncbi:MAG: toxin-antitoxin system HicB family antitoxin [Candidatus Vecturithrix sp.]|jgi:hypothetical protein|nr:toxin-antitoxin system HicB family antitoxin [Candidatus Vecturithrix sp.]
MSAIQIQLPEQLHQKTIEIARKHHLSVDEIVAASLSQWLSRIVPDSYLEERAKRSTGKGFSAVLEQVPDVPPEEYDRM